MDFSEPGFEPSAAFSPALRAAPSPRPVTLTRHVLVPCPLPPLYHSARLGGLPRGQRWAGPGSRARSAPGAAGETRAIRPCAACAASVHGQSSGVIRLSLPPAEPIHILITARPARERPLSRGGGSPPTPTCGPPAPAPSSFTFICTGEGSLGKPRPQLGRRGLLTNSAAGCGGPRGWRRGEPGYMGRGRDPDADRLTYRVMGRGKGVEWGWGSQRPRGT